MHLIFFYNILQYYKCSLSDFFQKYEQNVSTPSFWMIVYIPFIVSNVDKNDC